MKSSSEISLWPSMAAVFDVRAHARGPQRHLVRYAATTSPILSI
jgi:hypothetical protein